MELHSMGDDQEESIEPRAASGEEEEEEEVEPSDYESEYGSQGSFDNSKQNGSK